MKVICSALLFAAVCPSQASSSVLHHEGQHDVPHQHLRRLPIKAIESVSQKTTRREPRKSPSAEDKNGYNPWESRRHRGSRGGDKPSKVHSESAEFAEASVKDEAPDGMLNIEDSPRRGSFLILG